MFEEPSGGRVLIVEDEESNARVLSRLLRAEGYVVDAVGDGEAALAAAADFSPDIILLDAGLPTMSGFDVCRHLRADPSTQLVPVVFITGLDTTDRRIAAIQAGANDFLSKPYSVEELRARVRSLVQLKRRTDELESAESVILSLAATVEARDTYTSGHCMRMAAYAGALGQEMGMPAAALEALRRGAYLHDVGKIGIPDSVLLKPARLSETEMQVMRKHTIIGDALCGDMRSLAPVRPIVRHHHERLDGSGYPDGLAGDEVPLLAQIVAIADMYDAITTDRPYRSARSSSDACREIREEGRQGKLSVSLVDGFVGLAESGALAARVS
jgi:putative two-component system response regulator